MEKIIFTKLQPGIPFSLTRSGKLNNIKLNWVATYKDGSTINAINTETYSPVALNYRDFVYIEAN